MVCRYYHTSNHLKARRNHFFSRRREHKTNLPMAPPEALLSVRGAVYPHPLRQASWAGATAENILEAFALAGRIHDVSRWKDEIDDDRTDDSQ
jgi:hypothetical protein